MKCRLLLCALAVCLLTGCGSLLEKEYSTIEPHSSKFWESEAANTLRAENHQDIVNDLLLLIGRHAETATLRLYNFRDDIMVADTLEAATTEVQQETPIGSYAVEYITASSQSQRGYYEVILQISYRRSAEQLQNMVNATSPQALYSLLERAILAGDTELAVRMGYWGPEGETQLQDTIARLREELELEDAPRWVVNTYPHVGPVGVVEFLLDPSEEDYPPEPEIPENEEPTEEYPVESEELSEPEEKNENSE